MTIIFDLFLSDSKLIDAKKKKLSKDPEIHLFLKYASLLLFIFETSFHVCLIRYSRMNHELPDCQNSSLHQNLSTYHNLSMCQNFSIDQNFSINRNSSDGQNSTTPDVERGATDKYQSTTVVALSEAIKMIIFICLLAKNKGSELKNFISHKMSYDHLDKLVMLVPALLYTVQNNFTFFALSNLDSVTYQVTYQLRIIITAIFYVAIMKESLFWAQWLSLVTLTIGVCMVDVPWNSADDSKPSQINQNHLIGFGFLLFNVLSSSICSVYQEKVSEINKKKNDDWKAEKLLKYIYLAFSALIFDIIGCFIEHYTTQSEKSWFHDYDQFTVIIVCFQILDGVLMGLTVAFVMETSDTIIKFFAASVSIVSSTLISYYLLHDVQLSIEFLIGSVVVVLSTLLYGFAETEMCDSLCRESLDELRNFKTWLSNLWEQLRIWIRRNVCRRW